MKAKGMPLKSTTQEAMLMDGTPPRKWWVVQPPARRVPKENSKPPTKASANIRPSYLTQARDSDSPTATSRAPITAAMMVQWIPGW